MDGLTDDLKALVNAKELTLQQAVELNKQKAPKEEGGKIVNLYEEDEKTRQFTFSLHHDLHQLRSQTGNGNEIYWKKNGRNALVSPGMYTFAVLHELVH